MKESIVRCDICARVRSDPPNRFTSDERNWINILSDVSGDRYDICPDCQYCVTRAACLDIAEEIVSANERQYLEENIYANQDIAL